MGKTKILTKLSNGNVLIVDGTIKYSLNADAQVIQNGATGVFLRDKEGSQIDQFDVDSTLKVIREDTTEVAITDADILFSELHTYFFFKVASSGGTGATLITDATVISNITDAANWVTGDYLGDTTGLVNGNYYLDSTLNHRYDYLGTTLIRTPFNNV